MFQFKPIKPKKLKVEAFRDAILEEAESIAADVLLDYELTTSTWTHQPRFESMVEVESDGVAILVGTDDEVYRYVNEGTRPHMIYPKKPGGVLAFRSGYVSKTVPNVLGARQGGPSGDMVYARGVAHPGTEARNFDKIITKDWRPKIQKRMQAAMQAGAAASGHAI